jgi:hypothetical protein
MFRIISLDVKTLSMILGHCHHPHPYPPPLRGRDGWGAPAQKATGSVRGAPLEDRKMVGYRKDQAGGPRVSNSTHSFPKTIRKKLALLKST